MGGGTMVDTGTYSAQIFSLESQNRQLLRRRQEDQPVAISRSRKRKRPCRRRRRYTRTSHPDVIAAKERLKALRQAIPETVGSADNSAVQEQIRANNDAIAQLRAQRDAAVARATTAMAGQARAPVIQEQASQLESRANALRQQYNDVAANLMKAQAGARMAGEQRAERLSLVEPPSLPDQPQLAQSSAAHWLPARRPALSLGLLLALMVELLRRPMRSPVQIEWLGFPVLGIVPVYRTNCREAPLVAIPETES